MKAILITPLLLVLFTGCATTYTVLDPPNEPESSMIVTLDSVPSGVQVYELTEQGTLGKKMGRTPLKYRISFAQQDKRRDSDGKFFHDDWLVWADGDGRFVTWDTDDDNNANIYLNFGMVKDNSLVGVRRELKVAQLEPGESWPGNTAHRIVLNRNNTQDFTPASNYDRSSQPNRSQYQKAKRQYEDALKAYKKALTQLDNAKNMESLSDMSFGTMMRGSKLDRAVGLLNQGTTHLSLQEAKRKVRITKERLERAERRLEALDWK